jgi:hypothetical protein
MLKKFKHVITNSNIVFGYLQITIHTGYANVIVQSIYLDGRTDGQTDRLSLSYTGISIISLKLIEFFSIIYHQIYLCQI